MLRCSFVVLLLELGVFDEGLTVFAPVFWLERISLRQA